MPLASEDKMALRDYISGVRAGIERTNVLLEEIRDLLKSPPVEIRQDRRCEHQKESNMPAGSCSICGDKG